MKILFTGASSFTGHWFVRELAAAGHEVVVPFRRAPGAYEGVRAQRVEEAAKASRPVFECSFGEQEFLQLVASERWDVLCHHAAEAADYKNPDFDVVAALDSNTRNLRQVLDALAANGCAKVVLTGSVFEQDEGAGSEGLPAFSPYGVSKGLTWQVFRYHALAHGMRLGKFVIPNPFGPYEEPRFTSYLVTSWYAGRPPTVETPAYVRDNIHVSLLRKMYARFVQNLSDEPGFERIGPSGYAESQGAFARRFAEEMTARLGIPCPVKLTAQRHFSEPRVRINTDVPDPAALSWQEGQGWDEAARYYEEEFGNGR